MSLAYQPGRYVGRVISQGSGESKDKKHPQIILKFKPTARIEYTPDGEESLVNTTVEYERTVWLTINPTNPNSVEMSLKRLRYAGFMGDSFGDLNLVGTDCRFVCSVGEYNGEPSDSWELALPPLESKPAGQPIDTGVVKKLDALFGKALKASGGAKKAAPAAVKETVPSDAGDDSECPF